MLNKLINSLGITLVLSLVIFNFAFAQDNSDFPQMHMAYQMDAQGYPFSSIDVVRTATIKDGEKVYVETAKGVSYVPNEDGSTSNSQSDERVEFNDKHILKYTGKFTESDQTTFMEAHVNDGILFLMGRMSENDLALTTEFPLADFDFTTAYVTPYFFNDKDKGKVTKNILNFYGPEIRANNLEFLGTEKVEMAGKTFDCEKVTFDYEIIKGTMWIAKDEVGYFLVKEEAESAEYGPFGMKLTSYSVGKPAAQESSTDSDFEF